jgi:hypothetical protein
MTVGVACGVLVAIGVAVAAMGVHGTGVPGVGVWTTTGVITRPGLVKSFTLSTDGPSKTCPFQLLASVEKVKRSLIVAERNCVMSRQIVRQPWIGLACPKTVPLLGQVAPPSVEICALTTSYSLSE